MKIIFISDALCHHQVALCDEIFKQHSDFEFIETRERDSKRVLLNMEGFERPYCILYSDKKTIKKKIKESDVIIAGSVSARMLLCSKNGTKIYKYSERLFKKSFANLSLKEKAQRLAQNFLYRIIKKKHPFYLLAASAYAPCDFYECKIMEPSNMFRFGYFPNHSFQFDFKKCFDKHIEIVWCNRLIDWKHPEYAIKLGNEIKRLSLDCHINIIGDGPLMEYLCKQINDYSLENVVSILGQKKATDIKKYLNNSEISIYTSDRNEGWGVGVSESMASGCITIASKDIGCVPYLIKNGLNGLIYENSNLENFIDVTLYAINNFSNLGVLRKNAVETIFEKWSAKEAANRLLDLIKNNTIQVDEGPCSIAPIDI